MYHDSINKEHHYEGELLWLFLSCGKNPETFEQVVAQVVWENEKEKNEEFAKNQDYLADYKRLSWSNTSRHASSLEAGMTRQRPSN